MNENYWFAYSTHNSVDLSSNIFTIANNYFFIPPSNQIQNGNVLSVLDISDNNTKGGPSGAGGGDASMNSITDLSGAPLQPSPNATWFRLYDPSASFIVGPQGPTGDCGCTGHRQQETRDQQQDQHSKVTRFWCPYRRFTAKSGCGYSHGSNKNISTKGSSWT